MSFFWAPAPEAGGTPQGVTHGTQLGAAAAQNGAGGPQGPQRHGAGAIIMRQHDGLLRHIVYFHGSMCHLHRPRAAAAPNGPSGGAWARLWGRQWPFSIFGHKSMSMKPNPHCQPAPKTLLNGAIAAPSLRFRLVPWPKELLLMGPAAARGIGYWG